MTIFVKTFRMRNFVLSLFVIPSITIAQITINETDFANASDTVRMSSTSDFNVDFSTTGVNKTWDFSMLVAESQELLEFQDISNASSLSQFMFGGFAPVNYQASYFTSSDELPLDQLTAFLPVEITDIYQFTRITADSISSLGFSITVEGTEIPFRSDTIEKRYQLPMNYLDTFSGNGFTEMDLNPIANIVWRQYRDRFSVVDGWGTLSIPMGTYDVLRIRHTINETDSIYSDFSGTPTWYGMDLPTNYIYEWWTSLELKPVLRIETSEVLGNEVVTAVEFRDTYNPLLVNLDQLESTMIDVYPNPASDVIYMQGLPIGTSYSIADLSGREVQSGTMSKIGAIYVQLLRPGSYVLITKSDLGWSKTQFIKE